MSAKKRKKHATIRTNRPLSHAERVTFAKGTWMSDKKHPLTAQQYKAITYVSHARHQFHSHIDRMWKGFDIDDWNYLPNTKSHDPRRRMGNINHRLQQNGLPLIPFDTSEPYFTIDDWDSGVIVPVEKLYWEEVAQEDGYYLGQAKDYWERHAQQMTYRYLEHRNAEIEQYLKQIDRANGTHFHPSYSSRLHSAHFVSAEAAEQTMRLIRHS